MSIKVSIITICFNSYKTIEQTIKSVIEQDYDNIEYILIDGGSTDGTLDIIKKYENNITYWISEPDSGVYDAMNKGIKRATGNLIGFMNSDDWYAAGAVSAVVEAFSKTNADIIYGQMMLVENGACRIFDPGWVIRDCWHMFVGHQASFVKTDYQKSHPFDCTYRISADYAFMLDMFFESKKFYQIDKIIAYFRVGGLSSHPWRTYLENKRITLRISNGRLSNEQYLAMRNYFQRARLSPIFFFVCSKIRKKHKYNLYEQLRQYKFVLYGAGKIGAKLLDFMKNIKLDIIDFWDSNVSMQGKLLNGVPIHAPSPKVQHVKDMIILISTVRDNDVIVSELASLGYKKGREVYSMEMWVRYLVKMWLGKMIL